MACAQARLIRDIDGVDELPALRKFCPHHRQIGIPRIEHNTV